MMIDFKTYLLQKGFSRTSVATYGRIVRNYTYWCQQKRRKVIEIDYKMFLKYIKFLQNKGNAPKTLNHSINAIQHYYEYLISVGETTENPASDILVKGTKRNTLKIVLSNDELEDLYYSFSTTANTIKGKLSAKRNKVIVGLLVFQGLSTTDLKHLKLEHMQINRGKIYIPRSKKYNSRTLELKPCQVIEFNEYINVIRPQIQDFRTDFTDVLLITTGASNGLSNVMRSISLQLKKLNSNFRNTLQIRASVITLWLKQYSLRKTQVLAGHRFISSTEDYQVNDLEDLHNIVDNFHPFR